VNFLRVIAFFFSLSNFSETGVYGFFEEIESAETAVIPHVICPSYFVSVYDKNEKSLNNFRFSRYFSLGVSVYAIESVKINFSKKRKQRRRNYFCYSVSKQA
jgi:hypothetical protein